MLRCYLRAAERGGKKSIDSESQISPCSRWAHRGDAPAERRLLCPCGRLTWTGSSMRSSIVAT